MLAAGFAITILISTLHSALCSGLWDNVELNVPQEETNQDKTYPFGDHLDPWGLPLFEEPLEDSLADASQSHSNAEAGQSSGALGLPESNCERWDPSFHDDHAAAMSLDSDHHTSVGEASTATEPRTTSEMAQSSTMSATQFKKQVLARFAQLYWSPYMEVKHLTSHIDLLDGDRNPRAATSAIISALEKSGATHEYISAFKDQRLRNRQKKRYMENTSGIPVTGLRYGLAIENNPLCAGVDFERNSIFRIEEMTRQCPDLNLTRSIYDRALFDHIQNLRGAMDALSFQTFREEYRRQEFRNNYASASDGQFSVVV